MIHIEGIATPGGTKQPPKQHRLTPRGPFDLRRSIRFLEGWPAATLPPDQEKLKFACCCEHDWAPVGVTISALGSELTVSTTRSASADLVRQIARILSVDIDATSLAGVCDRDPVVAALSAAAPGLRPVCFWSPWEAACWALLSQRTSMHTASVLKQRIASTLGTAVLINGEQHWAFPAPQTVLAADRLPGVPTTKRDQIRELARAALDGVLTGDHLRGLDPGAALSELCLLPGVGAFSSGLILIRGAGAPNVFTTSEPRLLAAMRAVYGLPEDTSLTRYQEVAESWQPFRSWVAFLLRSASPQTLAAITDRSTTSTHKEQRHDR